MSSSPWGNMCVGVSADVRLLRMHVCVRLHAQKQFVHSQKYIHIWVYVYIYI